MMRMVIYPPSTDGVGNPSFVFSFFPLLNQVSSVFLAVPELKYARRKTISAQTKKGISYELHES